MAGTEETRQIGVVDWVAGVPLSEILQDDPSQTKIRSTFSDAWRPHGQLSFGF